MVPFLIGRDLLRKMKIELCQLLDYRYNAIELKELNKDISTPNETVTSALKLFNLFKSPLKQKPLALTTDANKCFSNDNAIEDNFVGCVNLKNIEDFEDVEEVIVLVGAIETDDEELKYDINKNLSKSDVSDIKESIDNDYMNNLGENKLSSYSMKIILTDDKPVHSCPRRLSYREKQEVQVTLDDLLKKGIISMSDSPYASPIVLVRKKNGQLRMCVDYRALNKITVRDRFPLPVIEDCLEYLGNKKYYTTLDLKNGFHQVPMHEDSKPLTAFVTPMGQFEYNFMPFGLANAPPKFQRIINGVLKKFIEDRKIVVYLDDIMIATEDLEEHKKILKEVLTTLAEAGLILNFEKCKFAYEEISYLGYVVNVMGVRPNDEHLQAIMEFPVPKNTKEVHCCVGLFSYFRKFVKDFSRIAKPLSQLTRKDAVFMWSDECMKAFEFLKLCLLTAPILCIFDPKKETELHTDASSKGFGAAIMQKQSDGLFHPVAFFSKCTSETESRYHSFELETLAIVYALRRFRMFLEGIKFTIITDCNSLTLTLNKKVINPRIARWALELENFEYKVRHRKGEQMAHVDALSRVLPVGVVDGSDIDLNIQISQSRDKVINELKDKLENQDVSVSGYVLENGLVFRVNDKNRRQLYVPAEWESNVMRLVHEKYGHVGIEKCIMQIQKNYWFPYMREKLNKFIRNCLKCIYYSPDSRSNRRNLYSIKKVPEPFHTIHIDHFGPLPSLKSKRKHVLAVVDSFTKFVKLYAVNGTSTKESWCALKKYFEAYSRPVRIYSDKGTCFTSAEFKRCLEEFNIKHVEASVASPQSNGQVERVNRVLKTMTAKMTEPIDHSDWVKQLSNVEFSLNNTVHCTTKQTPSKMLFGVEQRGENIDELTEYLQDCYGEEYKNLNEIRSQAQEAIQKSQLYNQKYFEEHHKPAKEFKKGDLVMIKHVDSTVGKNKKFNIKYRGPYVVRKCVGNDRYHITDVENCQLTQMPYDNIIDASRMRLWMENLNNLDETDLKCNTEETVVNKPDESFCTDYEYLDDEEICSEYEFLNS